MLPQAVHQTLAPRVSHFLAGPRSQGSSPSPGKARSQLLACASWEMGLCSSHYLLFIDKAVTLDSFLKLIYHVLSPLPLSIMLGGGWCVWRDAGFILQHPEDAAGTQDSPCPSPCRQQWDQGPHTPLCRMQEMNKQKEGTVGILAWESKRTSCH